MAHPYHHSLSSIKKWGGRVEDYQFLHDWFDASKAIIADFRHRALRHHAEGIFMAETIFGHTITLLYSSNLRMRAMIASESTSGRSSSNARSRAVSSKTFVPGLERSAKTETNKWL